MTYLLVWQSLLDHDNWHDRISAKLWAHLDAWENEGGSVR